MLDLLRMFLAASSRGEHTVLVLESRKSTITTKYRCVENLAGVPASSSTSTNGPRKKLNPARARRSKLRLEEFIKKKTAGTNLEPEIEPVEVRKDEVAAGVLVTRVRIGPHSADHLWPMHSGTEGSGWSELCLASDEYKRRRGHQRN